MTTNHSSPRWTGRTRFVTAASIVAVGLAGAVAIGANIGILDAAGSNDVGQLSAAGDLIDSGNTVGPQVVDVYLNQSGNPAVTDPARDGATASDAAAPADVVVEQAIASGSESFSVDAAGTVTIGRTTSGIRLEAVSPNPGWTWQLSQTDASTLTVSFTNGSRVLDFTATLNADGSITPEVVETITDPAGSNSQPSGGDDAHETSGSSQREGGGDDD